MLTSRLPQERKSDGSAATSHAAWKPHPMQGWGPDFIPKLTGDVVETNVIDRVITISGADAMRCSRQLAQQEGIFVGITAGATFAGALQVCRDAPKALRSSACCPIRGSATSAPRFSRISRRR